MQAIADHGTTARAADALGVYQSTAFRRISQFEDDLGVRLFTRDKRGFRLTLHGERVLPEIRQLAATAFDLERTVQASTKRFPEKFACRSTQQSSVI